MFQINFQQLKSFLSPLLDEIKSKVFIRQVAVGAKSEVMRFGALGLVRSSLDPSGPIHIDVLPLNDFLKDDFLPAFIKMNIEGAEIDGLLGGKKIVNCASPMLSICVYNLEDHLWRIPLFIHSQLKDYRF